MSPAEAQAALDERLREHEVALAAVKKHRALGEVLREQVRETEGAVLMARHDLQRAQIRAAHEAAFPSWAPPAVWLTPPSLTYAGCKGAIVGIDGRWLVVQMRVDEAVRYDISRGQPLTYGHVPALGRLDAMACVQAWRAACAARRGGGE